MQSHRPLPRDRIALRTSYTVDPSRLAEQVKVNGYRHLLETPPRYSQQEASPIRCGGHFPTLPRSPREISDLPCLLLYLRHQVREKGSGYQVWMARRRAAGCGSWTWTCPHWQWHWHCCTCAVRQEGTPGCWSCSEDCPRALPPATTSVDRSQGTATHGSRPSL
jgi:hypothetical protein